jgi:hypothetical protein
MNQMKVNPVKMKIVTFLKFHHLLAALHLNINKNKILKFIKIKISKNKNNKNNKY